MEQKTDLSPYLRILRKWWWLLLACTLVAGAFSYVGTRQMPRIYQATTTVIVGQTLQMANPSGADIYISQQLAQTYALMVTRQPILQGAAASLGLDFVPNAGNVTTRQVAGTQLLEISVRDVEPARAAALADAIAQELVAQTSTLEGEEGQRQAFVAEQLADLEANIDATRTEIAAEQARLDAANSARAIQEYRANIAALQQKLVSYQSNYASLLLTAQGGSNYVSVVEPATVPRRPVSPNVPQTVAVSAGLGLLLAIVGAVVLELLSDDIEDAEEAQRVTGLQLLASIWKLPANGHGEGLVTVRSPGSPSVEPFRVLRINVQYSSVDAPLRTVLVTSPGPSEGKSTILSNLAVVYAEAGQRVVIADTDLRRPVQHVIFGLKNDRGLSDLVRDRELALADCLQPGPVENLRVLCAGAVPPNPTQVLASQRMQEVLTALRAETDVLLLDSAPVLAAADASLLSTHVDGVILVADAGRTRRSMAKQAVEELHRAQANLVGLVLNRVVPRRSGSYYYYHRYYGQGVKGGRRGRKESSPSRLRRRRRDVAQGSPADAGDASPPSGSDVRPV
ncbi:MAG: polysaccharide biosynthesis tyrosine autokinase [Anaerolineae bacterium]|jgi:succinoglycan biosynthesis transport protein ExoP